MSGFGVTIELTGLDSVLKNIDTRQYESQRAVLVALLRLALLIERVAKDSYVPVITGRLKSSIGGQTAPAPQNPGDAILTKNIRGDSVEVMVGSNVEYAAAVEFKRKKGPWLQPAFNEAVRSAEKVTTQAIREALRL